MPSASKGCVFSSAVPVQPTHVPRLRCMTGPRAATRPPGLTRQPGEPSGSGIPSTGRRLATTTKEAGGTLADMPCTLGRRAKRPGPD